MLKEFDDKNWESEIKQESVTICQMSAHWCSPCKSLKILMEKLSIKNHHIFCHQIYIKILKVKLPDVY